MLRLVLDSHPNIAIGAETGFMGALLAVQQIPNWRYGSEWYQRLGWHEAELDARLRLFFSGMFERFATSQGKPRWGEKTPFHTNHMATMGEVFPSAVFVGIVRHPGAVAVSLRDSFHYPFADALSYWVATNLAMTQAAVDLGARFVLCRYEDVVTHRELVLPELVSWLGEPWSDSVLEHHRVQREKGAPRVVDGSTSTRDRIDASRAQSWFRGTSAADRDMLAQVSGLAGFFGYEAAGAAPPASLDPVGGDRSWLPDGDDLARRRPAWEGQVDFTARPPTLAIDASAEELAARLAQVENALARTRSRRSVRLGEALRKVQRGRSLHDVKGVWEVLRDLR